MGDSLVFPLAGTNVEKREMVKAFGWLVEQDPLEETSLWLGERMGRPVARVKRRAERRKRRVCRVDIIGRL